jgi:cyclin H
MATEDARYRQSSQYRLWSFSRAQLADLRSKTNALARESITERLTQRSSSSSDDGGSGAPPPALDFLTPADEQQLVNFYTVELLRAGKFINDGTAVQATAAVFFRRFYVTNSIMTYPPAEMMKTSLFFGAKAEGIYHTLGHFAEKFPATQAENVLAGEFLLCQGIRFSFDVKHPFRALEAAAMELRRLEDIEVR